MGGIWDETQALFGYQWDTIRHNLSWANLSPVLASFGPILISGWASSTWQVIRLRRTLSPRLPLSNRPSSNGIVQQTWTMMSTLSFSSS